jgi:Tol biopolymer transport system component/N-acetylneuraminic acid mutarotase
MVLVAGGFTDESGDDRAVADAYLYDPATGRWATTGALITGRQGHTATLLPDGAVLVAGGYTGGFIAPGDRLTSVERYDPVAGIWSAAASMSAARMGHSATLLRDGRVLVAGGGSAELYNPATDTWTRTGDLLGFRSGHTATLLADGTVLVVGGSGGAPAVEALATAERFDPATGSWSAAGHLAAPRGNHTATLLSSGAVLVAGGIGCEAAAEIYDPAANVWMSAGRLAVGRDGPTATLLPDGTVLVAGGYSCRPPGQGGPFLASVERYDPAIGTWSDAGELAFPRGYHTATLLPDGRLLLLGGLVSEPFEVYAPPGATAPPVADRIAFLSLDNGTDGFYTVRPDGTDRALLLALSALPPDSQPYAGGLTWSPDGTRLAFQSGEAGIVGPGNQDIYTIGADGRSLARLTDAPAEDFLPYWSPDGRQLAFLSTRDGNADLFVMAADGSGQANLTRSPADETYGCFFFAYNPWSPDGKRLAFNRYETASPGGQGPEATLYVMNADGTAQTRLGAGTFAGWSPDGASILTFVGDERGTTLALVRADGGGATTLLTLPGQIPQGFPVWSPDGQSIAFTADRGGQDVLYIMRRDGTGVTALTTGPCDGLYGTAWWPDGPRNAFVRGCPDLKAELYVINADDTGLVRLAERRALHPVWSPRPQGAFGGRRDGAVSSGTGYS